MKPFALGLALLAALTAFSLLDRNGAGTAAVPPQTPMLAPQPPTTPGDPEWTVQPIPTDGWDQDGLLHR